MGMMQAAMQLNGDAFVNLSGSCHPNLLERTCYEKIVKAVLRLSQRSKLKLRTARA
jgi:hypothetical protein